MTTHSPVPTRPAGRPLPAWLRDLTRLAGGHGWDSVSYRLVGAGDGYLYTRGAVEIDVRANTAGRVTRAVLTSPGQPAVDQRVGRRDAVRGWLTEPAAAAPPEPPRRFTRVHRGITTGGLNLVTHDDCRHCGGPITNNALTRRPDDTPGWVHVRQEDWANDVHPAIPAGGPVADTDRPGPWLIAGAPQ